MSTEGERETTVLLGTTEGAGNRYGAANHEADVEGGRVQQRRAPNANVEIDDFNCEDNLLCRTITWLFNRLFYLFCLVSGQFIIKIQRPISCKVFLELFIGVAGLLFFLLQFCANMLSLVYNFYIVVFCPYPSCSYFSLHNSSDYNDTGGGNGGEELAASLSSATLPVHVNWNNAVITTATIAGWISYLLMTFFILLPIHSNFTCRSCVRSTTNKKLTRMCDSFLKIFCTTLRNSFKHKETLSPFDDTTNIASSTKLMPIQAVYFYFVYMGNILLYLTNLGLLSVIMHNRISTYNVVQYYLDYSGLIFQMSSQFCAVHSCFIFSKVAYMVSTQLDRVVKTYDKVNIEDITAFSQEDNELRQYLVMENNNVNLEELLDSTDEDKIKARYYILQRIDQAFIKRMRASLDPYGMWFSIHWILYTLTTLLSCALFAQTVVKIFYQQDTPLYKLQNRDMFNLSYIVIFTLEHLLLFIYPCFRAASITVARERMIQTVSRKEWMYIPLSIKSHFIQYLRAQNFSFRVHIFCADIPFNFNTAYISLFIGIFGGILKFTV